jgi:hypothetical protein
MPDSRLVEACPAENSIAAHFIKNALESAGIPTRITGDSFAALGGLNPIWWESPRILVAEADAEKAATVLREIETARAARKSGDAD